MVTVYYLALLVNDYWSNLLGSLTMMEQNCISWQLSGIIWKTWENKIIGVYLLLRTVAVSLFISVLFGGECLIVVCECVTSGETLAGSSVKQTSVRVQGCSDATWESVNKHFYRVTGGPCTCYSSHASSEGVCGVRAYASLSVCVCLYMCVCVFVTGGREKETQVVVIGKGKCTNYPKIQHKIVNFCKLFESCSCICWRFHFTHMRTQYNLEVFELNDVSEYYHI